MYTVFEKPIEYRALVELTVDINILNSSIICLEWHLMKSLKKLSEQRKGLKPWDQWDGTCSYFHYMHLIYLYPSISV